MTTALATVTSTSIVVNVGDDSGLLDDVVIHVDDFKGWIGGGAGVRKSAKARLVAHGQFAERGYRDASLVTLDGIAWAQDRAGAAALVDLLSSLLADGNEGTLTVIDPDLGTRTLTVALYGAPKITWETDTDVEFSIDMLAADPRKYSPARTVQTGTAQGGDGMATPLFANGIMEFAQATQVRTNLATNPNFETGTTGWSDGANSTFATSTAQFHSGTQSFAVTRTNTTTGSCYAKISFPAVIGRTYTVSIWFYGGAGAANTYVLKQTTSASATTTFTPGNAWQRVSVTATATSTGTMNVFVADDNNTAPVSGTVFYVDDVLIEESATVGNNFDGSTPNAGNYSYAWTGAVGNSTSTETLVYPSAPSSSGMVTLVNSGTADTTPVFRIDGYAPGFTITRTGVGGTGARLVYADTVQAGSYVLINPADGSVLLDGYADRGGQLVVSEFETLAGAESATWLFESPGNVNATLQVSMGDAWW